MALSIRIKIVKKFLFIFLILILAIISYLLFCIDFKSLGNLPKGDYANKIHQSINYRDGQFVNRQDTTLMTQDTNKIVETVKFLFRDNSNLSPQKAITFEKIKFESLSKEDLLIWLGHSSFYMQLSGKKILVDPVLSNYASPINFINNAYQGTTVYKADDFKDLDMIVISHDHYDHLDRSSIEALKNQTKIFICPLGIKAILEGFGVDPSKIYEFDWDESITLTARHFSGRSLQANQTLWASFLFESDKLKVYYSGDSGYGEHFAQIGKKFKSIDYALLENGQYNAKWAQIHMFPAETTKACNDLNAQYLIPVHSGRFSLSDHSFKDPYNMLDRLSSDKEYMLLTPFYSDVVLLNKNNKPYEKWWLNF